MSDITNTSYCSKDFGSLYPEVLDLAKRITNSWDPSSSNESDPGVVLLKVAAMVGDHNNYNIDKNTLENFLPTATQDKSVRSIVEMNGYTPEYYVSASGDVSFNYTIPDDSDEEATTFVIPAFSLVISDTNETVTYTQVEDLAIVYDDTTNTTKKSATQACKFIQGTLNTLSVNGQSTILTENLDDNNRIYFPETMVAQNGIYVRYASDEEHKNYGNYWTRDNYLSTKPNGSRVYKVDYDSDKGFPYVEFPQDISNIIQSGLLITYFSTSGNAGNVSANTLVSIVSPTTVTDRSGNEHDTTNFTLTNVSSFANGKDPQTIEEMYTAFKKVVGTFDTLVTRDDYADRIYTFTDELDNYLVSNVFVTDRRNDINNAANVMTADVNGPYLENIGLQPNQLTFKGVVVSDNLPEDYVTYTKGSLIVWKQTSGTVYTMYCNISSGACNWEKCNTINLNDFTILSDVMTPYDLIIHALKAFSMTDYSSSAQYRALENAYTAVSDETRSELEDDLEEDKCINHVFKSPNPTNKEEPNDVFCYKNYAPLNITLTPYYKITSEIKADIIDNIYRAISENFNPRTLNWGEQLDTLEIKDVILNCDDRIRDVDITPIQYKTKVLRTSSITTSSIKEEDLVTGLSSAYFIDLIAKNILAGRLCLFNFDDRFNLSYNQIEGTTYSDCTDLSTEVKIKINSQPVNTSFTYEAGESFINEITISGDNNYYNLLTNDKNINNGNEYTLAWDETTKSGESFSVAYGSTESTASLNAVTYTSTANTRYTISYEGSAAALYHGNEGTFSPLSDVTKLIIKETTYTRSISDPITSVNYTLHDNEAIQIITPNYYSDTTYSTYVNYRYEDDGISSDKTIYAETDHELTANQKITLIYTSDGVEHQVQLTNPTVVRTSFDLVPTDTTSNPLKRTYTDSSGTHTNANFKSLSSSQTISTRQMMKTELTNNALRCYWNVNNTSGYNLLFDENEYERILENNEFFIYTNDAMNEMVVLGAGTRLVRSSNDDNNWLIDENNSKTTLSDVTSTGIQSDIAWQTVNLAGKPLDIIEMSIITLGEDDNIVITGWSYTGDDPYIDNEWKVCNGAIVYTSNGTTVTLPQLEDSAVNAYEIKSRLDIVSGADTPQELYCGGGSTSESYIDAVQTVSFTSNKENITIKADPDKHITFQTSQALALIGGSYIDTSLLDELDIYTYNKVTTVPDGFDEGGNDPSIKQTIVMDYSQSAEGFIRATGNTYIFKSVYQFYYDHTSTDNKEWILPIRIDGNAGIYVTAKLYYLNGSEISTINFRDYGSSSTTTSLELKPDTLYFLSPSTEVYGSAVNRTLYLELRWEIDKAMTESQILNVFDLRVAEGLNKLISKQSSITLTALQNRINTLISGSDKPSTKYYYTYDVDDGVHINLDTYCTKNASEDDGYSSLAFDNSAIMFDPANVASDKTIAQIDIRNSTIEVKSEMMK